MVLEDWLNEGYEFEPLLSSRARPKKVVGIQRRKIEGHFQEDGYPHKGGYHEGGWGNNWSLDGWRLVEIRFPAARPFCETLLSWTACPNSSKEMQSNRAHECNLEMGSMEAHDQIVKVMAKPRVGTIHISHHLS